jgi:hypothetical protein
LASSSRLGREVVDALGAGVDFAGLPVAVVGSLGGSCLGSTTSLGGGAKVPWFEPFPCVLVGTITAGFDEGISGRSDVDVVEAVGVDEPEA